MDSIYLVCAIVGGGLLVLQLVLQLFGGDSDVDGEFDTDAPTGDEFVKLLSIKTVVAGLTFFGLSGYASRQFELGPGLSLGIAVVAGLAALYVVAQLMSSLSLLQSRGNLDLANAVGSEAKCYLRIPPRGKGAGRVHVPVQGRMVECRAVSNGVEIPTGAAVRVLSIRGKRTVEVCPLDD